MKLLTVSASIVVLLTTVVVASANAEPKPPLRESGFGQVAYQGHGPEYWHWQYLKAKKIALSSPTITTAINLSCTVYGYCATLWSKARCESHLNPGAKNRSSTASGLFQFLTSTWAGTPFARFSIWDPFANALAAGWMHANGRGGEWVCS